MRLCRFGVRRRQDGDFARPALRQTAEPQSRSASSAWRPQASGLTRKRGAHHRRTPSFTCAAVVLRPGLTFFLDTMQSGYRFLLHSVELRPEVCAAFLDFAGRRQMGRDDWGTPMHILPPSLQAKLHERRRCGVKFKGQPHNVPSRVGRDSLRPLADRSCVLHDRVAGARPSPKRGRSGVGDRR